MRTTSVLTAAALVAAATLTGPTTAAHPAPTCNGEAATLVGGAYGSSAVLGTEGRDVVVTHGAGVQTGGGDDLVCVVAGKEKRTTLVVTGDGDDVVLANFGHAHTISAVLGGGSNRYEGSEGKDMVALDPQPGERSEISTHGGDDWVDLGLSRAPVGDAIDLGPGDDWLALVRVRSTPAATLVGGEGSDGIMGRAGRSRRHLDNRAQRLVAGKEVLASWDSFERFQLRNVSRLVFSGSSADEQLNVNGPRDPQVRASTGAGDDSVSLPRPGRGSRVRMGRGTDRLTVHTLSDLLDLDLAAGRLRVGRSGWRVPTSGVENAGLAAARVLLSGDGRPNRLVANACSGTVSGRGGDDHLSVHAPYPSDKRCPGQRRVVGGPGRDVLHGSVIADVLLGGPGRDRADGRGGRDRCRAEVTTRCES